MGLTTEATTDTIEAVSPAAKTVTFNGRNLDARNYRKVLFAAMVAAVTGTPTLDGKLQDAPDPTETSDLREASDLGDTWIALRNGANDNIELGQEWTSPGGAILVYRIRVKLRRLGTITAGKKVWLEIQTDSTSLPSGTAIQTSNKVEAADIVGGDGEDIEFYFPDADDLATATVFHVVLKGDYTESATNQVQLWIYAIGSGGSFEIKDATWAADATNDMEAQGFILTYTDIAGATFTQVTAANPDLEEVTVDRTVADPFLRYVGTIGGGSPNLTMAVVAVGGEKKILNG